MKVRFTTTTAGKNSAGEDFAYIGGGVYDFPASEAEYCVRHKMAVVEEKPKQRKVTVQRVRKTSKRPIK